jgi:hypothetical protein
MLDCAIDRIRHWPIDSAYWTVDLSRLRSTVTFGCLIFNLSLLVRLLELAEESKTAVYQTVGGGATKRQ